MEFYSERCSDWLEKNKHIHPDKLTMEVQRFEKLLNENHTQNDIQQQDHIDDLHLTIQLLKERLASLVVEEPNKERKKTIQTIEKPINEPWDMSSLTHHGEQATEILDPETRAQRKSEILNIAGIQLGTSDLKKRKKADILSKDESE